MGIGDYEFRLTAVYEDCESSYALTASGDDYVFLTVTAVDENVAEEMATVTMVYTMNGQQLRNVSLEDLSRGVYIVQGLTASGRLVVRKMVVN